MQKKLQRQMKQVRLPHNTSVEMTKLTFTSCDTNKATYHHPEVNTKDSDRNITIQTHLARNRNGIQNDQDHQIIRLIFVPDVEIPNIEMVSTALYKSSNANTVTKLDTLHT